VIIKILLPDGSNAGRSFRSPPVMISELQESMFILMRCIGTKNNK
jgi:hypothetical protein